VIIGISISIVISALFYFLGQGIGVGDAKLALPVVTDKYNNVDMGSEIKEILGDRRVIYLVPRNKTKPNLASLILSRMS
jgi:hypothetical protein